MRSPAEDICSLQRWGYTHGEALEYVTWRAVFEARHIAERPDLANDPDVLRDHLAYLDELRHICLGVVDSSVAV